mmetsp:Transcript_78874/g.189324  ORF Transcript_78874/g.189324 Transcript_78874/m.189324 type:complete len:291 (-) Transcript_78874:1376-2248(-)
MATAKVPKPGSSGLGLTLVAHKGCCIATDQAPAHLAASGDGGSEHVGVHEHQITLALCRQCATVPPRHPQCHFTEPVACLNGYRVHQRRSPILEFSAGHKVHACCLLSLDEDGVLCADPDLRHRLVTEPVQRPPIGLAELEEERMTAENRAVDCLAQLELQALRHFGQRFDILFMNAHSMILSMAAYPVIDALAHFRGHLILGEVLAKRRLLFLLLAVEISELRHRGRDVGDEGGERDQATNDRANGVDTLRSVNSIHLDRSRSELTQRPMERRKVLVPKLALEGSHVSI